MDWSAVVFLISSTAIWHFRRRFYVSWQTAPMCIIQAAHYWGLEKDGFMSWDEATDLDVLMWR